MDFRDTIVRELVYLMFDPSEQMCRIYDAAKQYKCVYDGSMEDIPKEYLTDEIYGIDNINNDGYLNINVDTDRR
jgi:hypothetical protein